MKDGLTLQRQRSAGTAIMGETNKYYVTVAVDRNVIPGAVLIRAADKNAAAERAEMKVALQMREAISVKAISVREA
jgi:predicted secreted protein